MPGAIDAGDTVRGNSGDFGSEGRREAVAATTCIAAGGFVPGFRAHPRGNRSQQGGRFKGFRLDSRLKAI